MDTDGHMVRAQARHPPGVPELFGRKFYFFQMGERQKREMLVFVFFCEYNLTFFLNPPPFPSLLCGLERHTLQKGVHNAVPAN